MDYAVALSGIDPPLDSLAPWLLRGAILSESFELIATPTTTKAVRWGHGMSLHVLFAHNGASYEADPRSFTS